MSEHSPSLRDRCDGQQERWEKALSEQRDMFGKSESEAARKTLTWLVNRSGAHILELGGAQGRDTIFFARKGFHVTVLDYSEMGLRLIRERADKAGCAEKVHVQCHDVRNPLPFAGASFDLCFSHMMYCMALTMPELEALSREIHRVLKPGGHNIYTVRHREDPHFGTGLCCGEDLYEVEGGFIVHFFTEEKVAHLSEGFKTLCMDRFEEGRLPRRLLFVAQKKE